MVSQERVFNVITGERIYQAGRWNEETTESGGKHTVTEWLLYIQDYLTEATHLVSRNPDPEATRMALDSIRKIAAMCVACMEQNGVVPRALPKDWKEKR
jgi:hypothetical protein